MKNKRKRKEGAQMFVWVSFNFLVCGLRQARQKQVKGESEGMKRGEKRERSETHKDTPATRKKKSTVRSSDSSNKAGEHLISNSMQLP